MSDITLSIAITIDPDHEGGYVDNPNDPGGATKYGITQRDLNITNPGTNVRDITSEFAANWYLTTRQPQRYNNPLYEQINDQDACNKIFDMGVLFGVGTAVRIAQQVVSVTVDGNFGPETLAAVNGAGEGFLGQYKIGLKQQAQSDVDVNPAEAEFKDGWDRRIDS